jgi:hypothetical protein
MVSLASTSREMRVGVVEAIQCALEIQKEIMVRNSGTPEDRRIKFREPDFSEPVFAPLSNDPGA